MGAKGGKSPSLCALTFGQAATAGAAGIRAAPSTNTSAHVYIGADANCIIKPRWTTGDWSKQLDVVATSASSITVRVNSSDTDTASAAEYIRDIGKGVYGWFRGYYKSDVTKKPFAVLGLSLIHI